VALSLRNGLAQGRYGGHDTLESLAQELTRALFAMTQDRHLAVAVVEGRSAAPASTVSDGETREMRARRANFGVQRVEVLAGNVGYLNLTWFYRLEEAREAISSAMQLLRSADALILDMRENGGGSPDTVALLASYLFDAHGLDLFEIVSRSGSGDRYTTLEPAVPERNGGRPVYVLTSTRTFSAGEGLAFILQERRRAEVIGEPTPGAANPGRPYPVHPRLEVTVPNAYVRTAMTGRNWEGVGVVPDLAVPARDALRSAHIRALRELLRGAQSGAWQEALKRHLAALELDKR
jgi:retinol-binding protein 3